MTFDGRVALITGACGGIGHDLAGALRVKGAKLFLVDVDPGALERIAGGLGGEHVGWVRSDVSDSRDVRAAVEQCVGAFGRIDFLLNVAGVISWMPTTDMPEEEWDRVLDTNLKGTFLLCQRVLPYMIHSRYGRIVNLSSDLARKGGPGTIHYSASKAGILGLTRALAQEVGPLGITVNSLAPSVVDTPMPRAGMSEQQLQERASGNPLGRIARPRDVTNAALFLLQDESDFINGQTLHVNGGALTL